MEEKYKKRRIVFISLIVLGIAAIIGSIVILATIQRFEVVGIVGILGVVMLFIGLPALTDNREKYRDYLRAKAKEERRLTRAEMRLSDLEIKKLMKESSLIDLEKFEKSKGIKFNFKYVEKRDIPKKVICMISKTQIKTKDSILQCPNCQNYFNRKYLIGWLYKNTDCPICQTTLKTKKT